MFQAVMEQKQIALRIETKIIKSAVYIMNLICSICDQICSLLEFIIQNFGAPGLCLHVYNDSKICHGMEIIGPIYDCIESHQ